MNLVYEYEVKLKSRKGQSLILFIEVLSQKDLKKIVSKKLEEMEEYAMYDYNIEAFELKNKKLFDLVKKEDLTELFFVSLVIHKKENNFSIKEIQKSLLKIKQGWDLKLALKFLELKLDKTFWFKLNNNYDFEDKLKGKLGFVKRTTPIRYTSEFEGVIVGGLFQEQMFDLNEILPINDEELSLLEGKTGYKINKNEILNEKQFLKIKEYLYLLEENYLDDFSDIEDYLD